MAILVGLAVGMTACGDSDETKVNDQSVAFIQAMGQKDTETACSLISGLTSDLIEGSSQFSCENSIVRVFGLRALDSPEVTDTQVDGDTAKVEVTVSGGDPVTVTLVKEDGDWKVGGATQ